MALTRAPESSASTLPSGWLDVTDPAYGADPTGKTDSTAAIQAAISALPFSLGGSSLGGQENSSQTTVFQGGGVVYFPTGTYLVSNTLTVSQGAVYLVGDGSWATMIKFTGSGDLLRVGAYANQNTFMGGISGMTLDGESSIAPATGLHAGDGAWYRIDDLAIQNFSGTGSIGLHLDNSVWYTEQLRCDVHVMSCQSAVVFDVTGTGYNSFARADVAVYLQSEAGQEGVVLQGGAAIYNGSLAIRGNMSSSKSSMTMGASLVITGQTTASSKSGAGNNSMIQDSRLEIGVETDSQTTPPTFISFPQTISFGTLGGNNILGCYGVLSWSYGTWRVTNWTNSSSGFGFTGPVTGDSNINGVTGNTVGRVVSTVPVRIAPVSTGSFTTLTNSATFTVIGAWTIPAKDPQTGSQYKLAAFGQVSSAASGAGTLQFLVQINGKTLMSLPACTLTVSLTDAPWAVQCVIDFSALGTSGVVNGMGTLFGGRIGGSAASDAQTQQPFDTTTGNFSVVVLAKFSVASPSNTVVVTAGTLTREAY